MKQLSDSIIHFFARQGFTIVSTLNPDGTIHCAAKGLAGIEQEGKLYLIDVYKGGTFTNLQQNPTISATSIDEHLFTGYTLKGKAEIVERKKIEDHLIKKWEERVIQRISKRVVKSVQGERRSHFHPEAQFPAPQYLIVMTVDDIVDLTPTHLKGAR